MPTTTITSIAAVASCAVGARFAEITSATGAMAAVEEARAKRYQSVTPVATYLEDYHILQTTKEEPLIRAIRNGMEGAGVPVETSKGEWGRGQEEINLEYAEAVEMADRTALYKHGAKEIAHALGCSVTFMAKYDMAAAGSSCSSGAPSWVGPR